MYFHIQNDRLKPKTREWTTFASSKDRVNRSLTSKEFSWFMDRSFVFGIGRYCIDRHDQDANECVKYKKERVYVNKISMAMMYVCCYGFGEIGKMQEI